MERVALDLASGLLAPCGRRDTLTRVMQALAEASVQILIMSTVAPDPVPGWTIVNVGA